MRAMEERIDIGMDGGGTGCRVVVCHRGAEARAEGGPANVVSDPAAAEAALRLALTDALAQLGLTMEHLTGARIVAGLAGCRLPGAADDFAMRLPYLAYVTDDSVTALEGALGGTDGSLISLGTGSFFIRKSGTDLVHHGGWGFHLGDEGSAAWLGRRALQWALRACDGRAPDDPLVAFLLDFLPTHPVVWAQTARPADYAALGRRVTETASPMATDLLKECAGVVEDALERLAHPPGAAWALTGGLGPFVVPHLPAALARTRVEPAASALHGALAMARALP